MTFGNTPSHPALLAKRAALAAEVAANGANTPLAKTLNTETGALLQACAKEAGHL